LEENGGGCSLLRTTLWVNFAAFQGKKQGIFPKIAFSQPERPQISYAEHQFAAETSRNSLENRTGDSGWLTGNYFLSAGNFQRASVNFSSSHRNTIHRRLQKFNPQMNHNSEATDLTF
jgi:hypothetical protein